MAIDAKFDRIQKIAQHENADALEIAIVSNFPCVVKKDAFKEGDIVFYIRDDAKLVEYDAWKEFMKRYEDPSALVPQDCYHAEKFAWQEGLLKYLGGGGRVRTIKLRGKTSMGILMKPEELGLGSALTLEGAEKINAKIADPETGSAFLEKEFGVAHWSAPLGNIGDMNVLHQGLDFGLGVSDEENWQNLHEEDLHLGVKCLVTKKLDGTSCTVICQPNGEWSVASRHMTFNVKQMEAEKQENIYTCFTREVVKAGLWYAKTHNEVIAIRGEICCSSVQRFSINKDKDLNGFFIYGVEFPGVENFYIKHGVYGSGKHFTDIVKEMESAGFSLKTVPVICESVVTRELLKEYNDKPASWGEGVVFNISCGDVKSSVFSTVWSYKSKSQDYLMNLK